jgi:hypothetical protein
LTPSTPSWPFTDFNRAIATRRSIVA